jgi:aldose 1-epimerase
MSFSINSFYSDDLEIIQILDNSTGCSVQVLPKFGALLHAFIVNSNQGPLNIIDNYANEEELQKELCLSYKSAKLSPFVCRIGQGRYQWDDKEHIFSKLFPDGTAIHGLLADQPFSITETTCNEEEGSIWFVHNYKGEDAGFPFHFKCEVKYTLQKGQSLRIETIVTNTGTKTMPLADGWHPYFSFGEPIAGNILGIASSKMLEFDEKLLPSGDFVTDASFAQPTPLGDRFLDNCFELDGSLGNPVCTLHSPAKGLTLSFITNKNYPYLQLYTPPHRNSIAIENLSGAPNCFNNGMGLIKLGAGEEQSFEVSYVVS